MGMKDISVNIKVDGVEQVQKTLKEISKALKKLGNQLYDVTIEVKGS